MRRFIEFIREAALEKNPVDINLFHGSGRRFDKFNQSFGRVKNDHMGGGLGYFTTSHGVAKTYAKNGASFAGTGTPFVYHTRLKMNNVFDVDHDFEGEKLKHVLPDEKDHEDFARGAGLMRPGVDKYDILAKLKRGDMKLTGQQVFKGLSRGGVNSAAARDHLIKRGYDGLRYNGGENMDQAERHDVYIPYNADSIEIHKRTKIVKKPQGE